MSGGILEQIIQCSANLPPYQYYPKTKDTDKGAPAVYKVSQRQIALAPKSIIQMPDLREI